MGPCFLLRLCGLAGTELELQTLQRLLEFSTALAGLDESVHFKVCIAEKWIQKLC